MATFNKFNPSSSIGREGAQSRLRHAQGRAHQHGAGGTDTVLANITQIAHGNGYTAGGTQATQSSSAQTSAPTSWCSTT